MARQQNLTTLSFEKKLKMGKIIKPSNRKNGVILEITWLDFIISQKFVVSFSYVERMSALLSIINGLR